MEGSIWCLEDILMYGGESEKKHQQLVEQVLEQCIKYGLVVNFTKSEFHVQETLFLEHIINGQQVQIDLTKLEAMSQWRTSTKKKEVQAFLDFANYYR